MKQGIHFYSNTCTGFFFFFRNYVLLSLLQNKNIFFHKIRVFKDTVLKNSCLYCHFYVSFDDESYNH